VWLVDVEGREDRAVYSAGPDKKASGTWLADGERVLVLAETDTHFRIGVLDAGSGSTTWLIDDPERGIEQAYVPRGSRTAVVLETRQARTRASLLDPDTGAETPLDVGSLTLVPIGPVDGECWAGLIYSSRQPHDLVRFLPSDLIPERLVSLAQTASRTALAPGALVGVEEMRWRSVDGQEIQGWLYRAREPVRGTVVQVHGGPTWHVEDQVLASVQYLVAEGFHVLVPNYRGSTGFGRAFREAIKATGFGGLEQEDIRTGIEALLASGLAQPGRVGITGTSYGGYSAWHAITHWPCELVSAAAPVCGMTDLAVDWETTRPDLRPLSEEMMGGTPADAPERYRERSPVHLVDGIRARLLIVQGMRDPNVHPENVKVVRSALERAGVPYDLLAFEDEGHGVARPANQKALYRRLAEFFASAFEAGAR